MPEETREEFIEMLGEDNPHPFGSPEYFAWIKEQAAKRAKEKAEEDRKAAARVEQKQRAAQGLPPKGMNPMVIAALVVGGGALLYMVLKKSR